MAPITVIKMLAVAMLSGLQIAYALPSPNGSEPLKLGRLLASRQSGQYITHTNLVGDGDPHQNTYEKQVSNNQDCGTAATCAVSVTSEHTVSYSFSIEGAYEWISGGFAVEESFTDGETHECGGNAGDRVCIWRSYDITAYTVADTTCYYFNGAASDCSTGNPYVTYSPNNCQSADFYCVNGDACRSDDQGYYNFDNAIAGGPPC